MTNIKDDAPDKQMVEVTEAMIEEGVRNHGGHRNIGEQVRAIYIAMRAVDPALALLKRERDDLREALRGLIDHPEVDLMLGGNPITVEAVVDAARAALSPNGGSQSEG